MPATPAKLEIKAKTLKDDAQYRGGTWSEITVPGDYEMELIDVEDYDNRKSSGGEVSGTKGWIFHYAIQTSTGPCVLRTWVPHSQAARWKVRDILIAHKAEQYGLVNLDPNMLIGGKIGGHIDFPRDASGEPTSNYRDIFEFFPLPDKADLPTENVPESNDDEPFGPADKAQTPREFHSPPPIDVPDPF